jgi:hypothetical protein
MDTAWTQLPEGRNGPRSYRIEVKLMARKSTGLEEATEAARLMFRWPALRNKEGDEIAYELATAVQKLHADVQRNVMDLEVGLEEIAPLMDQILSSKGGGGLFAEARKLAESLQTLRELTSPPGQARASR